MSQDSLYGQMVKQYLGNEFTGVAGKDNPSFSASLRTYLSDQPTADTQPGGGDSQVDMGDNSTMTTGQKQFTIDSFVDTIGKWEGTQDHTSQEQAQGETTYAYGVLPSTAKKFGVEYSNQDPADRRDNAVKVYSKMFDQMKAENASVPFDKLKPEETTALLSAYINLGSFKGSPSLVKEIEKGNVKGAAESLFLYHNLSKDGSMFSSKGLVARRAKEYNLFQRALGNTNNLIASVGVEGDRNKPVFILKDTKGKVIKKVEGKYPLDSGNSTKTVSVPSTTKTA